MGKYTWGPLKPNHMCTHRPNIWVQGWSVMAKRICGLGVGSWDPCGQYATAN